MSDAIRVRVMCRECGDPSCGHEFAGLRLDALDAATEAALLRVLLERRLYRDNAPGGGVAIPIIGGVRVARIADLIDLLAPAPAPEGGTNGA